MTNVEPFDASLAERISALKRVEAAQARLGAAAPHYVTENLCFVAVGIKAAAAALRDVADPHSRLVLLVADWLAEASAGRQADSI